MPSASADVPSATEKDSPCIPYILIQEDTRIQQDGRPMVSPGSTGILNSLENITIEGDTLDWADTVRLGTVFPLWGGIHFASLGPGHTGPIKW